MQEPLSRGSCLRAHAQTNSASQLGNALHGLWSVRRGILHPTEHFMSHQPTCQTPFIVFLDCGSTSPAACFRPQSLPAGNTHLRNSRKSRLLLAGDVESNPGPTPSPTPNRRRSGRPTAPSRRPQHQICDSCERPIFSHQETRALSCNQPDCTEKTHRNCNKCDVSRYNYNPIWTCRTHRGEAPRDNSVTVLAPSETAKVRCLNPDLHNS